MVIGTSPWEAGAKVKTAAGTTIWWEAKKDDNGDEKRVIMPDGVEVDRVASRVANGEVVSSLLLWNSGGKLLVLTEDV